jgi:hypothetical protein
MGQQEQVRIWTGLRSSRGASISTKPDGGQRSITRSKRKDRGWVSVARIIGRRGHTSAGQRITAVMTGDVGMTSQ